MTARWRSRSSAQPPERRVRRGDDLTVNTDTTRLTTALADLFGMALSIGAVALLTFASGLLVVVRMPETLRSH